MESLVRDILDVIIIYKEVDSAIVSMKKVNPPIDCDLNFIEITDERNND